MDTIKLCESVNPIEVYQGRNIDTMPKLLADGRIPCQPLN